MINCANQIRRVEILRESLEQSLKNCTKFNNTSNSITFASFSDSRNQLNCLPENGEASTYSSFSGSNNNGSQRRPLCLLFCSNTAAVIQISGVPVIKSASSSSVDSSRFTVSPTPNAMPAASKRQTPLCVIVSSTTNSLNSEPSSADSGFVESSSDHKSSKSRFDLDYKHESLESAKSVPLPTLEPSPASSLDSGLSSPAIISTEFGSHFSLSNSPPISISTFNNPLSSSIVSPATIKTDILHSAEQQHQQRKLRFRSASESENFENWENYMHFNRKNNLMDRKAINVSTGHISGSCDSINKENNVSLKGILKKPKFETTNSLKNHQRQSAPLRLPLFCSLNECGSQDLSPTDLSAFQSLGLSPTICKVIFDENEENNSPLEKEFPFQEDFRVSEINNNNNNESSNNSDSSMDKDKNDLLKKKVSFSEHVQARIYRSNSSILGQKKKNEKKNRLKNRRISESENSDAFCESENKVTSEVKLSSVNKNASDSSPRNNEARRDSGIEEESNMMLHQNTEYSILSSHAPPIKRSQRLISADSAFEEEDEFSNKNTEQNDLVRGIEA